MHLKNSISDADSVDRRNALKTMAAVAGSALSFPLDANAAAQRAVGGKSMFYAAIPAFHSPLTHFSH